MEKSGESRKELGGRIKSWSPKWMEVWKERGWMFVYFGRKELLFFFLGDIIMQGTDRNSFSNVGVQFC